jgi:hypothetical protein
MGTVIIGLIILFLGTVLSLEIRKKNISIWIKSWIKKEWKESHSGSTHILFCFVDHFEPQWENPSRQVEDERVNRWCREYPRIAKKYTDSDGRYPIHSFFYPEEEYRKEHLDKLQTLCTQGLAEIEIHLHHDNDTEKGLREKLGRFSKILAQQHGTLPIAVDTGKPVFGFIHGDWALDNSRKDGSCCGINNELIILREMGCYADFTLPSAPSDTQTSKINSIYYAMDDPDRAKSHDTGRDVYVGGKPWGDLMVIQGPLGLDWKNRKWGILPKIENSDISKASPPIASRIDHWVNMGIHVKGRPEWVFVKVHTHGAGEHDMDVLLGTPMEDMFAHLDERYNDKRNFYLHYVSAREMYNIAKAAEAGREGNPDEFRDYTLKPPENCR